VAMNPKIEPSPEMELICTPLHQQTQMHPRQIERPCSACGQQVGIYPTGQAAMKAYPHMKIICPDCSRLNPNKYDKSYSAGKPEEVLQEMRESKPVIVQ
jgi:hypothetical protein